MQKNLNIPTRQIKKSLDETSIRSVLTHLKNSHLLAFDSETNGLDYTRNKLYSVQLSNDGVKAYFILWSDIVKYGHVQLFTDVLNSADAVCTSNGKFDTKFLWISGCKYNAKNLWANDIISHVFNSNISKGLKPGAFRYTTFGGYDEKLSEVRHKLNVENFTQIPVNILKDYSGMDVIVTWRMFNALKQNIDRVDREYPNEKDSNWPIWRFITDYANPNYYQVLKAEYRGVNVDMDALHSGRENALKMIDQLKQVLTDYLNEDVDIINKKYESEIKQGKRKPIQKITTQFEFTSQKKLGDFLELLEWPEMPGKGRSAAGGLATSDPCLEYWHLHGKKGARVISDLRSWCVGIGTFLGITDDISSTDITGWPKYIRQHEDGSFRMHPNTMVMGTETFRHRMNSPNLQQIAGKGDLGVYVKKCLSLPIKNDYKIIIDNDKEWTTEYTEYFNTNNGRKHYSELTDFDQILSYSHDNTNEFGQFLSSNKMMGDL
jgi:DNA polymerase I-like protein with 3'-5' exonuclease and polymerase domains